MNNKLKILKDYCDKNLLNINTTKTQVVIFRKNGRNPKSSPSFYYGQDKIETAKKYTYLGIPFESSGLFLQASKSRIQLAGLASSSVLKILSSSRADAWDTKERLFEAMAESVLLYESHIWALRYAENCEVVQTRFFKKVLLLPTQTPNYGVRLETNRAPLIVKIIERAINFVGKILGMKLDRYPKLCYDRLRALESSGNCDVKCITGANNWGTYSETATLRSSGRIYPERT